jgi:hypothetical protein
MTRSGIGVGATLTPPAQLSLCSRFAALLIKGRDGVCRAAETRFIASPRDRTRGMSNISPSTKGGWRAEKRKPMVPRSLARPRRASRRANRGGYGTGPCFSRLRPDRIPSKLGQLAPSGTSQWVRRELRHRPSAYVAYTSSQAPHLVPPHERLAMTPFKLTR